MIDWRWMNEWMMIPKDKVDKKRWDMPLTKKWKQGHPKNKELFLSTSNPKTSKKTHQKVLKIFKKLIQVRNTFFDSLSWDKVNDERIGMKDVYGIAYFWACFWQVFGFAFLAKTNFFWPENRLFRAKRPFGLFWRPSKQAKGLKRPTFKHFLIRFLTENNMKNRSQTVISGFPIK